MGKQVLGFDQVVRLAESDAKSLMWSPVAPEGLSRPLSDRELGTHPSLDFVHHHWALPDAPDPGGPGIRGGLRSKFGRWVFHCLRRYLAEERELISHLIRMTDALAKRCDELAGTHNALLVEIEGRAAAVAANQAQLAAVLDRNLNPTTPN